MVSSNNSFNTSSSISFNTPSPISYLIPHLLFDKLEFTRRVSRAIAVIQSASQFQGEVRDVINRSCSRHRMLDLLQGLVRYAPFYRGKLLLCVFTASFMRLYAACFMRVYGYDCNWVKWIPWRTIHTALFRSCHFFLICKKLKLNVKYSLTSKSIYFHIYTYSVVKLIKLS